MFKCLLLFLVCVVAVKSVPRDVRRYDLERADQYFEEFVKLHQKQYANEQERKMRFSIFKDNLERINKRNMESKTAVFGINKFTDFRLEELQQPYTGLRQAPRAVVCQNYTIVGDIPTNKTFDWRDHNVVTRVKYQTNRLCWTSWAFSAIGNLESQYAMKYNELKEFSEQVLVDCDAYDNGCFGYGMPDNAFLWLKWLGGLILEEDYPYTGKEAKCQFHEKKVQASVSECYIPAIYDGKPYVGNETKLEKYLVDMGPLSIVVDANTFWDYEGGILDQCENGFPTHSVLLVGYGEENGTDYWLIKNSWGKDWGENGYVRILKHTNCCLMTSFVSSAVLK